jgi:hypothetical protein
VVQYNSKKGWCLSCDSCHFRISILTGAGLVTRGHEKCEECASYKLNVQYKDNSPFPGGAKSRTACILCDPVMKSTIVNFFFKTQKQKTPQELEEQERIKLERKREKEEKKRIREEEAKANPAAATKQPEKKKKKKKDSIQPNILSAEDRLNEFMRKIQGAKD